MNNEYLTPEQNAEIEKHTDMTANQEFEDDIEWLKKSEKDDEPIEKEITEADAMPEEPEAQEPVATNLFVPYALPVINN